MTASTTTGETETASDTVQSASDTNSGTSSGGADSSTSGNGSAEGSSTGEGSSSSTGEGSSSSTGGGSSSSTGDTGSGLYGPCAGDLTCAAAFDCEEVDLRGNAGLNWCSQPCNGPEDCPDPDESTANGFCRPGAGVGDPSICALGCDEETSCPSGMDCYIPMGTTNGFCAFAADYVP